MASSIFLLYFSFWATSALASSKPLWVVGKGETAFEASNALNLSSPELLVDMNPGMVPEKIPEGATYTVSYTTPLNPPARWSTADGTTFLQLRERSASPASTAPLSASSGTSPFLSETTSFGITEVTDRVQDSSINAVVKRTSSYIDDIVHPSPRSTASGSSPSHDVQKTAPSSANTAFANTTLALVCSSATSSLSFASFDVSVSGHFAVIS